MIVSHPAVKIASHKMKHTKYYVYLSLFPAVTVEFDPTSYTVSESDRYANITVVKRGQTTQTVSVNFNTADGNAIGKSSLCVCANSRVLCFTLCHTITCRLLVSAMLAVLKSLTLTFSHAKL